MSLRGSQTKLAKKQILHLLGELDSSKDAPSKAFALYHLFKILNNTPFKSVENDDYWIEPIPDMSRSGRDTPEDDAVVSYFNERDGLPRIAKLLASKQSEIIINNVAAVIVVLTKSMWKDGNKVFLAQHGAVMHLISYLKTMESEGVRFWAAVALRNLGRNDNTKALMASSGAIPILVSLLSSPSECVQAAALCCLVNVSNNDENERRIAQEGAIPIICRLMKAKNEIVMNNAIWALNNLSFKDENKISVAQNGGIPTLINLILSAQSEETQEYSAYVIWNLTFKNDLNKILICQEGGIRALNHLLSSGRPNLQKAGLGALNNITSRVSAIPFNTIEESLSVSHLVALLQADTDAEIARHTNSIFRNLLTVEQGTRWLVESNAVPLLVRQIKSKLGGSTSVFAATESETFGTERAPPNSIDSTVADIASLSVLKDIVKKMGATVEVPTASGAPLAGKLVNNSQFSDLKFIVDGKPIFAHKAILFSRSEYWAALFTSGMNDATKSDLTIPKNPLHDYASFIDLLTFVYTDECSIHSGNVMSLLDLARFYGFPRLSILCEQYLSDHIDDDNVLELLRVCSEYDLTQLRFIVIRHLMTSTNSPQTIADEVLDLMNFQNSRPQCLRLACR